MNTERYLEIKSLVSTRKKTAGKDDPIVVAMSELIATVDRLKTRNGELKLQRDSWKGEFRAMLHDRRNAAGEKSDEIVQELYDAMVERKAKKEEA